jgi:predicted ATPase
MKNTQLIVITGASKSGKSTLVERLSKRGITTIGETARFLCPNPGETIQEFQLRIIKEQLKMEKEAPEDLPVLLDRSLLDYFAFLDYSGQVFSNINREEFSPPHRYSRIFMLDVKKQYAPKTENRYSSESQETALESIYKNHNYEIVHLPFIDLDKREELILSLIH